jgi:sugar phosphate isomerase/epimerase
LRTLAAKGYRGALSVELFRAELVEGDPFRVAEQIRDKCETVMRSAQVL